MDGRSAGRGLDLVVLDPPRKGLAPEVVSALKGRPPGKILYLSCNPATLARGHRPAPRPLPAPQVCLFDFFPRRPISKLWPSWKNRDMLGRNYVSLVPDFPANCPQAAGCRVPSNSEGGLDALGYQPRMKSSTEASSGRSKGIPATGLKAIAFTLPEPPG